jgi:cytochrome c oxidase subunit 2
MFANTLRRALCSLWGVFVLLGAGNAFAGFSDTLNMRKGVTDISHRVYDLHMLIFSICVVVCIGVFAVLIYSLMHHRKSKGAVPATFHESTTVEIIWTTIPFLVLVGMAIPATTTLLALEDTRNPDMTIEVTGYQWKWKYDYLNEGISFFSVLSTPVDQTKLDSSTKKDSEYLLEVDKPVVVPINKKIRFLFTSNDVIHSWWVPDLGWKQDAIPGFENDAWTELKKPGTYRGKCAELCGKGHGYMPIVLVAKTQEDYDAWVADQKKASAAAAAAGKKTWTRAELMAKGQSVYSANCVFCHQANGEGIPGQFPALAGSKIATGPVAGHIDRVMHGKAGTAMQAFGPQLDDADLAAVITFERNSFGNNTGDVVQPSDIAAAR